MTSMATGTKALATPNTIAPAVLASMRSSSGIGAGRSRSSDRPRFSKVVVTASRLVVPNSTDTDITPGSNGELWLHPPGVAAEPAVRRAGQAELVQELARPTRARSLSHSVQRAAETEVSKPLSSG